MKELLKRIVIIILLLCSVQKIIAQTDSLNKKTDSANASVLNEFNRRIAEIERQRVRDSVLKTELEIELNSLKTTDNLKKEELQNQLQELNSKEAKRIAEKKAQIDSMRFTAKSYPVMGFFDDTLFTIYSRLGSFSAGDRASAIQMRIKDIRNTVGFTSDSLLIISSESTVDLMVGDRIVMSISENDALWASLTKDELARKYHKIISDEIIYYRSQTSVSSLAKEIGLALLVLGIIIALIFYVRKFFKWTAQKIVSQEGKTINGIKIRNYTLFDASREVNAILTVNKIVKWFFILLIIYIALPVLFGIFPWTKNFADTLFGYIINPVKKILIGFWRYLPNLITIIVVVFVFRYVLRGIHFLKTEIEKGSLTLPGFYPDWANPTYQIVRVLVFAFMIVVIFPYLPGSDSPVFQGVSVFLGFLFTFGSAGSLSNTVSGLVLTYMRLFKIGDRVKIGDVTGDVIEKSLLVTRVRTIKSEIISIPNSSVMNGHTINYSSDATAKGLIIHTTVTIGYDVPWREMHSALIDAAKKTNHILKDPKPFVLQTSLDDFYVSYQINAYVREANLQAVIYSELHQNIQDICNERGIEILSPHYRAARDGNMVTIPANYLAKDYVAPSFNVKISKDE
ncbi:MAG TPA: mechanosensitive ion channel [Bacteroidia bacterium]|nr:mechanosensitive ion channel [Bacteroidia bacterium]